jgi:hypothetical protein
MTVTTPLRPAAILLAALACGSAFAAPPAAGDTPQAAPAEATAAAKRVIRDKATGQLREPTAAEAADLEAELAAQRPAAPAAPLVVRQHANGMTSVVLGTEQMVTVQARRAPDGRLVRSHNHPKYEHPTAPAAAPARPIE